MDRGIMGWFVLAEFWFVAPGPTGTYDVRTGREIDLSRI